MRALFVICFLALGSSIAARAEEGVSFLAQSGEWGALAHRPTMIAAPDVCMLANVNKGVMFRADSDGIEFRVIDKNWTLPPNVEGQVILSIGNWSNNLPISGNTDQMIITELPEKIIESIFNAMDNSSNMSMIIGKAKPVSISLVGSKKPTNAFRTCAGIHSNAQAPGENPFR